MSIDMDFGSRPCPEMIFCRVSIHELSEFLLTYWPMTNYNVSINHPHKSLLWWTGSPVRAAEAWSTAIRGCRVPPAVARSWRDDCGTSETTAAAR